MKIAHIEVIEAVIPFDDGGSGLGITPGRWDSLEFVLVRVETDTGLVGWGECFAYSCRAAVAAAARSMVAPLLQGRELPATPEALTLELQRRLHLFGRYGITMFAISGFDIALWDIAAKAQDKPLHALLGGARRSEIPAYASLVRYGDAELVQKYCREAVAQGYRYIKLHEIEPDILRAGRAASGPGIGLSVDVNCAWSTEQARERIAVLREVDAMWVEEPVFPPEDIRTQAQLNSAFPLGAGENACTRHEFARMLEAGAVRFAQPSVIKVGGITEFVAVAALAEAQGVTVMPHSPYFGPGYFATLQLGAGLAGEPLFEHLYVKPGADLAEGGTPLPVRGTVRIPQVPGHGFVPDAQVLARYRV
ncbi:mandelate racemase/muconate lactonizing enzyme family protein [Variovorax sp. VRV01]|uniref:mandelate racemase/muconate lactonizing enzyme family protein n=1 Tax=Variovorax sp. VRV01 TaxID=2769259 RepID=UPI00177FD6B0|nr:mandelate racemase/muconate lactonizing enzyme family protein [Variovorax sp. VRV01]MBD9665474.1 mandelate racemase/muconate lactonizing enzyme family protein [Variovorax sp. VRV01]